MFPALFSRPLLVLSGLTALFVSLSILFDPVSFYAGYGVKLDNSVSLVNELKASAGALLSAGLLALWGAVRPRMTRFATAVSALFFLSYGTARVLSLVVDGVPWSETLLALGIELGLGILCLGSLWGQQGTGSDRTSSIRPGGRHPERHLVIPTKGKEQPFGRRLHRDPP